ncbi:MAG: hypothetical protein ABEJ55_07335 [Halanaeroarchaeum sp.]
MPARRREHALRGLVGALAFLVLAQGYRLVTTQGPGLALLLPLALVVWFAGTVASARLADYLAGKRRV